MAAVVVAGVEGAAGVVGVVVTGVEVLAAGAGVQFAGSLGPIATPFEQAAIVTAGARKTISRVSVRFIPSGYCLLRIFTGTRSPVDTMAAEKPLSAE